MSKRVANSLFEAHKKSYKRVRKYIAPESRQRRDMEDLILIIKNLDDLCDWMGIVIYSIEDAILETYPTWEHVTLFFHCLAFSTFLTVFLIRRFPELHNPHRYYRRLRTVSESDSD